MSAELLMLSNILILFFLLFLLPSVFLSIRVFFQWVSSSHQVAKVLELQLQHQSFQWIFRVDLFYDWLICSSCNLRGHRESSPALQSEIITSSALSLLYNPTLTSVHDYWKDHSFDNMQVCWQSAIFAFKHSCLGFPQLSLQRVSFISWLQSPSAMILESKKIKFVSASTFSLSICH